MFQFRKGFQSWHKFKLYFPRNEKNKYVYVEIQKKNTFTKDCPKAWFPFTIFERKKIEIRDDVKKYRIPRALGRLNVEKFQLSGSTQISHALSEWKPR